MIAYLAPVRERYDRVAGRTDELERVLAMGGERAGAMAADYARGRARADGCRGRPVGAGRGTVPR